jgi:hypothetical protein
MSPSASWIDFETLSTYSNALQLDDLPEEPEKPTFLALCRAGLQRSGQCCFPL